MHDADFTSGHFLGLAPAANGIGALSTGRPAVVNEPLGGRALGRRLAKWQGAADGLLSRTSFHGLLDAVRACQGRDSMVLLDERAYPIAVWAAAATASEGGMIVHTYRHLSASDAASKVHRLGRPAIVLTDGLCGSCLRPAPLADLAAIARASGGRLVIDDSLAAGILGPRGTGTPSWLGLPPAERVWVASCAKAFAAPIAAITGPREVVGDIRSSGPTRVHASAPTTCDISALRRALADPTLDFRRARLAGLVDAVRRKFREAGFTLLGIPFPVVSVPERGWSAVQFQRRLLSRGVRCLVTASRCRQGRALTVCLRSDLSEDDIAKLLSAIRPISARRAA